MRILFVVTALLVGLSVQATDSKCARELTQSSRTNTENFIAYVAELYAQGTIADIALLTNFEVEAAVPNPIPVDRSTTHTAAAVARLAFAEIIATQDLDARAIQKWARQKVNERCIIQQKRGEVKVETVSTNYKMQFHTVLPGMHGDVTLAHKIAAMSTQVTQKMWIDVMGENPSHFIDRLHADHPVEQVSWWSAAEYANRLSIKMGLNPVYNFSAMRFEVGTKAEDGSLKRESGGIKINARDINAPDGDVYQTEGFRLPTEAEAEYLFRAAGQINGNSDFGASNFDLKDHAWYSVNSNKKTHPVGELKPLLIDGKGFYDLYGNVMEWIDAWHRDFPTALNPVVRGGSFQHGAASVRSLQLYVITPTKTMDIGFRLVRTLK